MSWAEAARLRERAGGLCPPPDAGPALIETAVIYRDEFGKPEVAQRLLERVIADARRDDQPATATLAKELLDGIK